MQKDFINILCFISKNTPLISASYIPSAFSINCCCCCWSYTSFSISIFL